MDTGQVVLGAIREYNEEFRIRAGVAAVIGAVTLFVTFLLIVVVCALVLGVTHWFLLSVVVFGAYMGASVWTLRKQEDPLADLGPIVEENAPAIAATWAATGTVVSPRHAVRGVASFIIHGPACIVEAMGLWRGILPEDPQTVRSAAEALESLRNEGSLKLDAIQPARIAVVLARTGMIKPERKSIQNPTIVLTAKADDALAPRRSRQAN